MIQGLVDLRTPNRTTLTIFCESLSTESHKISRNDIVNGRRLEQFYSNENTCGVVLGYDKTSIVMLLHLSCRGKLCTCTQVAKNILQTKSMGTVPWEVTSYPACALLHNEGEKAFLSTFYGHNDIQNELLSETVYSIRDCFFSYAQIEDHYLLSNIWEGSYQDNDSDEAAVAAMTLAVPLYSRMTSWPKPAGVGITIFQQSGKETIMQAVDPCPPPMAPRKMPKKPVNSYNWYSKACRNAVRSESNTEMGTNELNTLLGKKWKAMSANEKAPYREQARLDKIRYNKEVASMLHDGPAQSLTAYNHFLLQEKQFIRILGLNDARTGTGKHGGDRWNVMQRCEETLYEVLSEVESEATSGV